MAGESPDKVERRESSGETTGDGGAVASTDTEKPGRKRERKSGDGRGAAGVSSTEASGEARDGASGGASGAPSESSDSEPGEAEAEAAEDSADRGADAGAEGSAEAAEPGGVGTGGEAPGRNDERLKAAVAAWVAGPEDEPDDAEQSAESTDDGEVVKDGTANSRAREKNSSQNSASDLPVRPKTADGAEPESPSAAEGPDSAESPVAPAEEVDQLTAMFRTVRPGSDDFAAATDSEEAARRAERMTAAFFGTGKTPVAGGSAQVSDRADDAGDGDGDVGVGGDASRADGGDGGDDADATGGGDGGRERGDGAAGASRGGKDSEGERGEEPEPGGPGTDRATAVFRTLDPDAAASGTSKDSTGKGAEDPTDSTGKGAKDPKGRTGKGAAGEAERGVDQATAVFRTVEPGERDDGADAGKADADAKPAAPEDPRSYAPAKTGEAAKPESGASAPAKSEAREPESAKPEPGESGTTPDKAGPGTAQPEPEKPEAGKSEAAEPAPDHPTGDKPAELEGDKPAKPEAESDSERTSQFVALRSADAPPRTKRAPGPAGPPKPVGRPTVGAELPPEVEPRPLSEAELTRQQVRPDQAPLDLLAQLTNTPPPPETPLRTAARRVKIWTPLVVLLAIVFAVVQAVRPLPDPELSLSAAPTHSFQGPKPSVPWPAEGQAALDVQGLGSFGSSGRQKPVPIASVAKVMTAYVILRDHPVKKGSVGKKIPVDKKAEKEAGLSAQNESTVEVKEGDTLSEREAVQAVLIASANNVARLLARWDAGSEKAFAKKMNAAAADLGMKDTKYTDPSGLTSSTVSTARDQVKLAKKAMGIDLFRETVRLPGYTDAKGEQHGNWNKLVPLDGVVGIKTGTTTKAGGNLLFAAERKIGGTDQLIVGAVLGQYEPSILDTVLAESKKLIDTAQDALRAQKVVQKGEVVGYVDDQLGGRTPVVASRDVSAVGWSGLKVKLALTDGGKALPHEGKAGDRAGTLTVGDGPGQVRVPVKLKEDMTEPGLGAKLTRIL